MERYETYRPLADLPSQFSHGYVSETNDGVVVVTLYGEGSSRALNLRFKDVPAFRCVMEECRLSGFEGIWDEPEKNVPCFIVHNSEWVTQFSEAELVHHRNPTHYAFLTAWREIEVLSTSPPEVSWQTAASQETHPK